MFYQADICGYNLILGCPLILSNAMGPLPHRRCLVIESEDDLFYPLPRSQGDVPVLETVPPLILADVLPDRPSRCITSSYTIKSEYFRTMLQHFCCPTPTVDAFASASNHRFPRYWTEMDSSSLSSWSKDFIWANPLVEWLVQLVKEFISDIAQKILLLPDSASTCRSKEAAYRGALDSITLANYTFPPHTKLFLRENAFEGQYLGSLGRRIPRRPAIGGGHRQDFSRVIPI